MTETGQDFGRKPMAGDNWITLTGCRDKHKNEYVHEIRRAHISEIRRFHAKGASSEGLPCIALLITNFGVEIPIYSAENLKVIEKAMDLPPLPEQAKPAQVIAAIPPPNRVEEMVALKRQQAETEARIKSLAATTGKETPPTNELVTHDQ